ncbi:MAG: PDZ domain-containing protein, partial [Candidatus Methylomirabilales bacterium]
MLKHRLSLLLSLLLTLLAVQGFSAEPAAPARVPGWLGVSIQERGEALAEELAKCFGVEAGTGVLSEPPQEGVVVAFVEAGSPADGAGLQPWDVILAIEGANVASLKAYLEALRRAPPAYP